MSDGLTSISELTPSEMTQLTSRGFIKSYHRYRPQLIGLAKSVYTATCHLLDAPPTEDQFYRAYSASLRWANLYIERIACKTGHLPLPLYEYYAGLLAKYVLAQDWAEISSTPCP